MEKMIEMQRYPPAGLVIDGDLTDYGHNPQLEEFKVRLNRNPPRIVPSPSHTIHAPDSLWLYYTRMCDEYPSESMM